MKKSIFFCAALFACAFAFQSCDQVKSDNPATVDEATYDLQKGMTLGDYIDKYAVDGVVVLPAGAVVNLDEPIELDQTLTIVSDPEDPATIIAKAGFVVSDNFTLKDVKIDAAEVTTPFIALNPEGGKVKNQDVYTDAQTKDFYLLGEIAIENVMIKDLKNALVSSNGQDWALVSLIIENSIIQLDNGDKNTLIAFDATKNNKGAIKNIKIQKNTIYNLQENKSKYFIRFANASNAQGAFGTKNGTSTYDWKISSNTIIRTMTAKDFGNNIVNNAKVTSTFNNNLLYDVYRVYQYLQNNQVRETVGNFVFYNVTKAADCTNDQSRKDSNGNPYTTVLETAPFEVPTTSLDLTKKNGGLNLTPSGEASATGDPRWLTVD